MIIHTPNKQHTTLLAGLTLLICLLTACKHPAPEQGAPLFEALDRVRTGLDFTNKLTPTKDFNVFKYMYFYNGGGVGAGDFNNDGRIDLFFAANQSGNKLYLNQGDLHFRDVTTEASIPQDGGWSTGVSVIDINNDGLLDIYICRVGDHETLHNHNLLLVCQGIDSNGVPRYEDKAKEYGLDFSGFSTQAVFFDYDMDGDLDMYLLNHSIHQNGAFGARSDKLQTYNPLSGDRLYRNDGNNHFTDVTRQAGIHSSVIGYGLGITVADINLDGYPDIYIGNDFHENDYLYINQHDGTFKDELNDHLMHTSQFSMGVDVADINNDGYPDVMTADMLPYDPTILKRSEGEDTWDIFNLKIGYGYNYQYTRNNLQLNRRNGMFSEIGLYAGVYATDWSWSPLWIDFDNDGVKDLFIANGIPKRLNDIDYINYVSNEEIQQKMSSDHLEKKDLDLIEKFPQIKIPSKFFKNSPQLEFTDLAGSIAGARPSYSNGAIYADLDNDGDLDLVVNNIDDPALLYENKTNDNHKNSSLNGNGSPGGKTPTPFLEIRLKGPEKNRNAIGAKVILFTGDEIRTYDKFPVRGFLSSMETPIHIGLDHTRVDSLFLVWPDNSFQRIQAPPSVSGQPSASAQSAVSGQPSVAGQPSLPGQSAASTITLEYREGLPRFDYSLITAHWKNPARPMQDITRQTGLLHRHEENDFHEFDREPLIPHMLSTEGPALAIADINKDGLQDIYIGSSREKKNYLFLQQPSGRFLVSHQPDLDADSSFEDIDACWADIDHDGNPDLVIAGGGNEYAPNDPHLAPRVYLNDGKGHLKRSTHAFDNIFVNASCVTPCDFNGDGYIDLFIGGRSVPSEYGQVPRSYLLQNDGAGRFRDVTDQLAPGLSKIGFVTKALWFDLDKDGGKDLLLCLEWGGILAYMNPYGHPGNITPSGAASGTPSFTKKVLTDKKGWWNFILPVDLNNDGNIDLIAGNLGLNSRLKASPKEPVRIYYYDFDGNGKKEQLLTYYLDGRELPFANKEELEQQMPGLKKNFLYAEDFAKATLKDIFPEEKLRQADTLSADYFSNAILINQGGLHFTLQPMPWEAQLSPYRDAVVVDANGDNLPDILLVGNYYENNIQMGRYDADFGTILLNKGGNTFTAGPLNGVVLKGQTRHISPIKIAGRDAYIVVRNNDSTRVLQFQSTGQ